MRSRDEARGAVMHVAATRAGVLLVALVTWEVWARTQDPLLYVPPSKVLPALWRLVRLEAYPSLPEHLGLTVVEVLVAYALAIALGIGVGLLLGLPRHLGEIYEPILSALYAIPSVVWYPSLMLFFGLGPASKIAFGLLLGFFPVVLAVLVGIRSVDRDLVTVARALGAGPGACFVKVVLPGMTATLLAGLRAGLALTVVGVIVGEVLGARAGLGYLINYAYGFLRTADYVALAIVALSLVMAIDGVAGLAERRARRWAG